MGSNPTGTALSVSMIVKNEEAMIANCLESVKDADEIIVCDTGSTDNTVEIAKTYTDKVYTDYLWNDDFAEARNHALSKCTGDYVLSIDADETLEPGGIEKIRRVISPKYMVYDIRMESSNTVWNYAKLWRRDPSIYWTSPIHVMLNKPAEISSGVTIYFGHSPSHLDDPDRTLRILLKEVKKDPKPRHMYYLGFEYFDRNNYERAIFWFSMCTDKSNWQPEISECYLMMAKCYWHMNDGNNARMACINAIWYNPMFEEAHRFMAEISYEPAKSKWLKLAQAADNTDVIFIRNSQHSS